MTLSVFVVRPKVLDVPAKVCEKICTMWDKAGKRCLHDRNREALPFREWNHPMGYCFRGVGEIEVAKKRI